MKRISNKEQEKPRQYRPHKLHDLRLTPDGLRVVCAGPDNDPEKTGVHMPEMPARFGNEGTADEAEWLRTDLNRK